MSLRKAKLLLQKQKQLQAQEQQINEQQQEEEKPKKQQINTFSAFNQSDSEEEQIPEEKEDEKPERKEVDKVEKKKKKKNKNKNKNKEKEKEGKEDEEREIREVEQTLKELGFKQQQTEQKEEEDNQEWPYILSISEGKFNYEKELRRHFRGWEPEKEGGDPDLNKKEQKMQKHLKKMMKKSVLSPGVGEYFPIREKFDMQREDNAIKFQASKKYASIQREYDVVRNSNDVNALFQFSQMNPQHVDSLYAVGEFLRLQGNYRDADNLIQRVIYIYEMAGGYDLSEFIKQPFIKKYIVYDDISKSFFMSIFKFMDILGKKGCFRTALEYNKFLLKININDPTACLLSIDFNAVSSKQYSYLLSFTKHFSSYIGAKNQSLYLMPNFCYSVALARMFEQTDVKKESEVLVEESKIDTVLDFTNQHWQQALKLPTDDSFTAEDPRVLILRAIMVYPRLIVDIASKNEYSKQFLNHQLFKGWQKKPFKQIMDHQFWKIIPVSYSYYFLKLDSVEDSQGLDKVLEVYVERSKILWKSNEVMLWVKGALGMVLNKIQQKFDYQTHLQTLCLEDVKTLPIPFQLSRYAHVNKNNFSDRVERIDLNNIQDNQPRPQGQQLNMNQNPFSLFINSLLPWVNLPGGQHQEQLDPDMPFIQEDD